MSVPASPSDRSRQAASEAGVIAHDLNNLLTAILGYTDLLLSERDEASPDRADLQEIQTAGRRAAALTRQLLDLTRPVAGNTEDGSR